MLETLFLVSLAAASFLVLAWGFRVLPQERWQVIASIPLRKDVAGGWSGLNLTWYGLISATAGSFALALFFVLATSVGMTAVEFVAVALPLMALGLPSAKLMARLVEKKTDTLTIGGAVFVTTLAAPPVAMLVSYAADRWNGGPIPVVPLLAAASVSYIFGEGFGRLACISFGCCYGKPLSSLRPRWRGLFEKLAFTFHGETKKIAYASGLAGVKVVPIQAVTAVVYVGTGLVALWAYFSERFAVALALSFLVAQGWRLYSETLRADYRGGGRISAYQKMTVAAMIYVGASAFVVPPASAVAVDLGAGLASLADGWTAVAIQALWVLVFLFTGRSKVTGCTVSFHVRRDRV